MLICGSHEWMFLCQVKHQRWLGTCKIWSAHLNVLGEEVNDNISTLEYVYTTLGARWPMSVKCLHNMPTIRMTCIIEYWLHTARTKASENVGGRIGGTLSFSETNLVCKFDKNLQQFDVTNCKLQDFNATIWDKGDANHCRWKKQAGIYTGWMVEESTEVSSMSVKPSLARNAKCAIIITEPGANRRYVILSKCKTRQLHWKASTCLWKTVSAKLHLLLLSETASTTLPCVLPRGSCLSQASM